MMSREGWKETAQGTVFQKPGRKAIGQNIWLRLGLYDVRSKVINSRHNG